MYIKYQKDNGDLIIETFHSAFKQCEDGRIVYWINMNYIYETHANEDGSTPKNKGELMLDKIYKALELKLPVVDLTVD